MSLAAKLPYTHAYAGGYPSLGSQRLPTDSDCLTYLAAVAAADGAGVEVGVAMAVDEFFRDTKASGVFSALKASCILAGARTLAGALVPVVGDAPTNVANGFVEGDYSRTAGLTGDGATTYLDSGRAGNADPQNDQHMSVYHSAIGDPGGGSLGSGAGVGGATNLAAGATGQYGSRHRSANFYGSGVTPSAGFFGASRESSSAYVMRYDGVNDAVSIASQTPYPNTYFVFARNDSSPGLEAFSNSTIAYYSIGTSLSLEALDTAVTNLLTAIGEAL